MTMLTPIRLPVVRRGHPGRGGEATRTPPPAPETARRASRLTDSHGRTIRDLRLSLTDRCNFRCIYCLDPGARFLPPEALLGVDDFERLARVAARMGVRTIRLTGGEPTLHPRLEEIIERLAAIGGPEITMTTNGSRLEPERLARWKRAGLSRLTISIDAAGPEAFARITRSAWNADDLLRGIEAAVAGDLAPVKLNAVIVRGENEDEVLGLAGLARRFGVEMRFIEFMPLDASRAWSMDRMVSADEILGRIDRAYGLVKLPPRDPGSTAELYAFADGGPGRIGMIAPVTRPFCGECRRLRITADGRVRPCLFSHIEWDLRPLLRAGASDRQLTDFLVDATWTKSRGHGITRPGFASPERTMSAIGG